MTLAFLLLLAPASAQEETAEDFRGFLDQARFFLRREWYEDAERELEKAVAHPDGRYDPEAWYMLAQVRYRLHDIAGAREAGSLAHTYSATEEQLTVAAGFSAYVHEQFGLVEVQTSQPGLPARLDIALTSQLFDPNLQTYLEEVKDRRRRKHVLPIRFGLPVGTYTINGQAVEVAADRLASVHLGANELGTGPAAARLLEAEVSFGLATWVGPAVGNLYPSFNGQIAVDQPVGPVRVGVMVDWTPSTYRMIGGQVDLNTSGFSLGGRVGFEVPGTAPLVIRASAGYRYAFVPGLRLDCVAAEAGYACGSPEETDLVLYAVGRAHVPLLELAVHHLDKQRTTGLGFGVKGVVERAFGTFPGQGDARFVSDGGAMAYETDPESTAWQATGLRVLANLSLAF